MATPTRHVGPAKVVTEVSGCPASPTGPGEPVQHSFKYVRYSLINEIQICACVVRGGKVLAHATAIVYDVRERERRGGRCRGHEDLHRAMPELRGCGRGNGPASLAPRRFGAGRGPALAGGLRPRVR